jgi:hypothetical protein
MKRPIFTTNPTFSLPWFSADDYSTAFVIDHLFLGAKQVGCPNGCVEGMLQRGEIPTVMLLSSGDAYQSSLNPNYKKICEVPESERLWSIYEFEPPAPVSNGLTER